MILLPRLDRGEVDLVGGQLNLSLADPEDALKLVDQLELKPHWNLSGGSEIAPKDRNEIVESLEGIAREHGYPDYPTVASQQVFDRNACRLLHHSEVLRGAKGDTKRAAAWAGLTCLDVPHLAIWRHSEKGKGISRDRLHGGPRNFLRRLWLRKSALLLNETESQDSWELIDQMSEDAVVQIIERPSLASDRRLASLMGLEWIKHRKNGIDMEPVMRLATRRLRATSQTRMLSALNDRMLQQVVAEAFNYAIQQTQ